MFDLSFFPALAPLLVLAIGAMLAPEFQDRTYGQKATAERRGQQVAGLAGRTGIS